MVRGESHLISKFKKTFCDEVNGLHIIYNTPRMPKQHLIRNTDPVIVLNKRQHKISFSTVGMFLWSVKHSRPDIANCVQDL
ncbi:LOW QUALITY PROTEIN: hypothetical protein ACHAWF_003690 [Thalassiosira exigua]